MVCLGIFDDMVGALDFEEKAGQRVITNLTQNLLSVSSLSLRFTCKSGILRVEPRRFEPLTSAVQRRAERRFANLPQFETAAQAARWEEIFRASYQAAFGGSVSDLSLFSGDEERRVFQEMRTEFAPVLQEMIDSGIITPNGAPAGGPAPDGLGGHDGDDDGDDLGDDLGDNDELQEPVWRD